MEAKALSASKTASQIDLSDGFTPTTSYRTLTLDTLSEKDDYRLKTRERRPIPYPWGSLTTKGIDKAQTAPLYKYTNKEAQKSLSKTFDEAGMQPKKLISTKQISDATNRIVHDARRRKQVQKPRGTNPLDPNYHLPSFVEEIAPAPRFIKDNLDTSDIKGTSPLPVQKPFLRTSLFLDDIEGTKVGWRPRYREKFGKTIRDLNLDVKDINKRKKKSVNFAKEAIDTGVKQRIKRSDSVTYSLKTDDIDGARSRTRVAYYPRDRERTNYRCTNCTEDIAGATPKVKARTKRPYSAPIDRTDVEPRAKQMLEGKIQARIQKQYADLLSGFKQMDRDGSGKVTPDEFIKVMGECDIKVKSHEASLALKGFDTNNSGYLDYQKLLKSIGPSYISKHIHSKAQHPVTQVQTDLSLKDDLVTSGKREDAAPAASAAPGPASQPEASPAAPADAPAKLFTPRTRKSKDDEYEWKPSKYGAIKADRPYTSHAATRTQKAKDERMRARPTSSPSRRNAKGASVRIKHPEAERPKSAFPLRCRMQTWENSQLREDIATIRALK